MPSTSTTTTTTTTATTTPSGGPPQRPAPPTNLGMFERRDETRTFPSVYNRWDQHVNLDEGFFLVFRTRFQNKEMIPFCSVHRCNKYRYVERGHSTASRVYIYVTVNRCFHSLRSFLLTVAWICVGFFLMDYYFHFANRIFTLVCTVIYEVIIE